MGFARVRLNRRTALVLAIAGATAVAILVAAFSVHQGANVQIVGSTAGGSYTVVEPSSTFAQQDGWWGVWLIAFPLVATLVAAASMGLRSPGKSGPGPFAVAAAALLVVEGVLGILTIGIYVLPTAVLVSFACATYTEFEMRRRDLGAGSTRH
jgi:uncharacterized membrane protein YhaH (DUF805 family)